MRINIEFQTFDEMAAFAEKIRPIGSVSGIALFAKEAVAPSTAVVVAEGISEEQPAPAKKPNVQPRIKRARKPKVEAKSGFTPAAEAALVTQGNVAVVQTTTLRDRFSAYVTQGVEQARALLTEFEVARFSDLTSEQIPGFDATLTARMSV